MCANCEGPFQGNTNDMAVPVINPCFVIAERNVRWSIVGMLERELIAKVIAWIEECFPNMQHHFKNSLPHETIIVGQVPQETFPP